MSDGVEWAAHACLVLAALPEDVGLPAAALAELHDLPPAYMAKHMQALARAGVVASERGAKGGYRLARPADRVTLWDIVEAVEGPEPAFRCSEIRQQGPCAAKPEECRKACQIAAAFHSAERAWRIELKNVTLAELLADVARKQTPEKRAQAAAWLREKLS